MPEVIDPDVLRAVVGDDPAMIREIVADFVPAAQSGIAEILAAVASAVPERVRMASHKLKGSSGLVGARELAEVCAQLEAAGRVGNWDLIGELSPQLDRLMREVETAADIFLRDPLR
jgi:HPt (histidine-containing phosphotransfer) domain-containing protein